MNRRLLAKQSKFICVSMLVVLFSLLSSIFNCGRFFFATLSGKGFQEAKKEKRLDPVAILKMLNE